MKHRETCTCEERDEVRDAWAMLTELYRAIARARQHTFAWGRNGVKR